MRLTDLLAALRLGLIPALLMLGWLQLAQAYFWTLLIALGADVASRCLARRRSQAASRSGALDRRANLAFPLSMPVGVSLLFPRLARHHTVLLIMLIGAYLLIDAVGLLRRQAARPGAQATGRILTGPPPWTTDRRMELLDFPTSLGVAPALLARTGRKRETAPP